MFWLHGLFKIEKNGNQKDRDQKWRENKLQGVVWFFRGAGEN